MLRCALCVLVAASASLLTGRDAVAVVGGQEISVRSAPWAVFVQDTFPKGQGVSCSGAIVDASHVLTAAHCLFDRAGDFARPSQLTVVAGVSDFRQPAPRDVEQKRSVSSVRVDPGYVSRLTPTNADATHDLAVLTLSRPLNFGTPYVQAVPFAPATLAERAAAPVLLASFGNTSAQGGSGHLVAATLRISSRQVCGFPTGLVCASSKTAGLCPGDSGAGLVDTAQHQLVALAVAGGCRKATHAFFVDVTTASAQRFIHGTSGRGTPPKPAATRWVPSGWASVNVTQGKSPTPLVFSLPRAWLVNKTAKGVIAWDPKTDTDVRIGITGAYTTRAQFFAAARRTELRQYRSIDPHADLRARQVRLPGARAFEIDGHLSAGNGSKKTRLLLTECLVFHDTTGYALRYATPAKSAKSVLPIVEKSLRTLHFAR